MVPILALLFARRFYAGTGPNGAMSGLGLALSVSTKKAADFSTAFCMCPFSSVAVGADTHAHAGSAEADTATFFITTAFDVPLARSVVTIRVANDYASVTVFAPTTAVFAAYHADVLDVAVGDYR